MHSAPSEGKMNAAASSTAVEFIGGNGGGGSDSDTNPDDPPDYYQPISFVDEGELSDQDPNSEDEINGHQDLDFHHLANGYAEAHYLENGISSLDLGEDDREYDDDDEEAEAVTESERAMERAFREDERRRNAPLTAENAGRVIEAMRQVSFGGSPPDWAGRIPEDQWVDRLRSRRLSRLPSASA